MQFQTASRWLIYRGKLRRDRLNQLMEEKTGEEMEAGQRLRLSVEASALFWSWRCQQPQTADSGKLMLSGSAPESSTVQTVMWPTRSKMCSVSFLNCSWIKCKKKRASIHQQQHSCRNLTGFGRSSMWRVSKAPKMWRGQQKIRTSAQTARAQCH